MLFILIKILFLLARFQMASSWSGMNSRALKLFEKKGRVNAHIRFCLECKKRKIIPNGFKTKSNIRTQKAHLLEQKFAMKRMMEELRQAHAKQDRIMKEIEQLKLELSLSQTDMEKLHKKQILRIRKLGKLRNRKWEN